MTYFFSPVSQSFHQISDVTMLPTRRASLSLGYQKKKNHTLSSWQTPYSKPGNMREWPARPRQKSLFGPSHLASITTLRPSPERSTCFRSLPGPPGILYIQAAWSFCAHSEKHERLALSEDLCSEQVSYSRIILRKKHLLGGGKCVFPPNLSCFTLTKALANSLPP